MWSFFIAHHIKPSGIINKLLKMASNLLLLHLLLLSLSFFTFSGAANSVTAASATSFIRSKCRATTYPSVCVQSLAIYAPTIRRNPKQLAQTALSVSLQRAQSSRAFVAKLTRFRGLKPREYAALKDCLEVTSDSADRLLKSMGEFKYLNRVTGQDRIWHLANMQTWVSAAITDGTTCSDGFAGRALNGRIKSSVSSRMASMGQLTSNALALINQLA